MKIQYTEYAPNPNLRGKIAHLPQHRAQPLIDQGVAIEIPYSSYIERLQEEEAVRQSSLPQIAATVQWTVSKGEINGRYYISAKCSAPNCSTLVYDAPPSPALESISFCHSCGGRAPEKIPATVAAEYRKAHRVPAEMGADEAAYYHAARPQPSQRVDLDGPQRFNGEIVGPPLRELGKKTSAWDRENSGVKNYLPSPGDGQPANLEPLRKQFKDRTK